MCKECNKFKKYDNIMIKTAKLWAEESYCERAKVGAVISLGGRIISNGYNGTAPGAKNCCEEEALRCEDCGTRSNNCSELTCSKCGGKFIKDTKTKKDVVHAEANAILFAARNGIKIEGSTIYVTLAPCIDCAKMIKHSGIKRVVYDSDYRKSEGIDFLKENKVEVQNIKDL